MAPDLRIIWCETCEGTGRHECGPYEINRNDGSVYGHEYECHACEGVGSVQVEFGPITLDDLDAMEAGAPKIVTSHVFPPIPSRNFDWNAVTDNYEPGAPIGFGCTEQAAIADLLEQIEGDEP